MMLISEFARRTGLPADTIRFYVRRGLLAPEIGLKGGANPYQIFTEEHVERARTIRLAQSLGFTLKEIAALNAEYERGAMTPERAREVAVRQLAALEAKATDAERMIAYVRAKIAWLDEGGDVPPRLSDFAPERNAA